MKPNRKKKLVNNFTSWLTLSNVLGYFISSTKIKITHKIHTEPIDTSLVKMRKLINYKTLLDLSIWLWPGLNGKLFILYAVISSRFHGIVYVVSKLLIGVKFVIKLINGLGQLINIFIMVLDLTRSAVRPWDRSIAT